MFRTNLTVIAFFISMLASGCAWEEDSIDVADHTHTDHAVPADGEDGRSITNLTINEDGELIVTYSDNTKSNLGLVVGNDGSDGSAGATGATGATGTAGVGISNVMVNMQGNLLVTLSTGQVIDAGTVRGATGATGSAGVGISNVMVNAQGNLLVTLSTGQVIDAGTVRGATGATGPQGPQGGTERTSRIFQSYDAGCFGSGVRQTQEMYVDAYPFNGICDPGEEVDPVSFCVLPILTPPTDDIVWWVWVPDGSEQDGWTLSDTNPNDGDGDDDACDLYHFGDSAPEVFDIGVRPTQWSDLDGQALCTRYLSTPTYQASAVRFCGVDADADLRWPDARLFDADDCTTEVFELIRPE